MRQFLLFYRMVNLLELLMGIIAKYMRNNLFNMCLILGLFFFCYY